MVGSSREMLPQYEHMLWNAQAVGEWGGSLRALSLVGRSVELSLGRPIDLSIHVLHRSGVRSIDQCIYEPINLNLFAGHANYQFTYPTINGSIYLPTHIPIQLYLFIDVCIS